MANCLFLGQIVIFRAYIFCPPSKMPSRTPMSSITRLVSHRTKHKVHPTMFCS